VNVSVVYHPSGSHFLAHGLELGLDERHNASFALEESECRRNDPGYRNEGNIDCSDVDEFRDRKRVAGINALENYHAVVFAKPPIELAFTYVYGIHSRRTTFEKTVREPARGRTNVYSNLAFDIQTEGIESILQFQPSPAHIFVWLSESNESSCWYQNPGLRDRDPVCRDFAGKNEGRRIRLAWSDAMPNQEQVNSFTVLSRFRRHAAIIGAEQQKGQRLVNYLRK
jgi:hypothetical protein